MYFTKFFQNQQTDQTDSASIYTAYNLPGFQQWRFSLAARLETGKINKWLKWKDCIETKTTISERIFWDYGLANNS